jgi:predicted transcriptional regulator
MKEINDWITAKSLGEALDISGRSVSGTMRKLVGDGFVEKKAGTPASYKITEKGLGFNLEEKENAE